MKRVMLAAAVVLVLATPASAGLPIFKNGSSVGEGLPLKAYATITPTVHLFGDSITAKLAIVADTKWVDPARLQVTTDFAPYEQTKVPTILRLRVGRFAQVTWTWTLRCLDVPMRPPAAAERPVPRLPVPCRRTSRTYGPTASLRTASMRAGRRSRSCRR